MKSLPVDWYVSNINKKLVGSQMTKINNDLCDWERFTVHVGTSMPGTRLKTVLLLHYIIFTYYDWNENESNL